MNKTAEDLYLAGQIMAEGFMDKLAEELEKEAKEEKQKRTLQGVLLGATPRGKTLRGLGLGLGTSGLAFHLGRRPYRSVAKDLAKIQEKLNKLMM